MPFFRMGEYQPNSVREGTDRGERESKQEKGNVAPLMVSTIRDKEQRYEECSSYTHTYSPAALKFDLPEQKSIFNHHNKHPKDPAWETECVCVCVFEGGFIN